LRIPMKIGSDSAARLPPIPIQGCRFIGALAT
jgi:hypothetical protein